MRRLLRRLLKRLFLPHSDNTLTATFTHTNGIFSGTSATTLAPPLFFYFIFFIYSHFVSTAPTEAPTCDLNAEAHAEPQLCENVPPRLRPVSATCSKMTKMDLWGFLSAGLERDLLVHSLKSVHAPS